MGRAKKFPGKQLIMSMDKILTKKLLQATSQRLNHCLCGVTFQLGIGACWEGMWLGIRALCWGHRPQLMEPSVKMPLFAFP